jgi:hypothetical protein
MRGTPTRPLRRAPPTASSPTAPRATRDSSAAGSRLPVRMRRALLLAGALTAPACGDGDAVGPGPARGALRITASTVGEFLEPPTYRVAVEGYGSRALPGDGGVTFTGVAPGQRRVTLDEVPSTCSVSGGAVRSVTVPAGAEAEVSFAIVCRDFLVP